MFTFFQIYTQKKLIKYLYYCIQPLVELQKKSLHLEDVSIYILVLFCLLQSK